MFEYFYNEIFRKTIISFGTLFNDVSIKHTDSDDDGVTWGDFKITVVNGYFIIDEQRAFYSLGATITIGLLAVE